MVTAAKGDLRDYADRLSVALGFRVSGLQDKALAALHAARAHCPDDVTAQGLPIGEFFGLGDFDAALSVSLRALALAPGNPGLLARHGWILKKKGDLKNAIPFF